MEGAASFEVLLSFGGSYCGLSGVKIGADIATRTVFDQSKRLNALSVAVFIDTPSEG